MTLTFHVLAYVVGYVVCYFVYRWLRKKEQADDWTEGNRIAVMILAMSSWFGVIGSLIVVLLNKKLSEKNKPAKW